jgi:cellulose synthase/poly-beta-1,6-N-acetylglucosamine synthase-like glycosyltransferase/peptidoglycan/xylan/chitin deacetylase (PgdA/CDA1 family)
LDLTGYVVSDNTYAINGVDQNSQYLTSMAATGGYITPSGVFAYLGVQNALVHAHLQGARAELVVQNFNLANTSANADFDPQLAHDLLKSDAIQAEFVKSLRQTLVTEGWDGVVIDFENLNAGDQKAFVHFLRILHKALASKIRLVAAVPPRDPGYTSSMQYDLAGISQNTDLVNVMTYNQHDPSGSAGPIGEPSWIKASLANVYQYIPKNKLQLGIAGYGYLWGPSVAKYTNTVTPSQARLIVKRDHGVARYDSVAAEWTAKLPDGSVLWWNDARSIAARAALAKSLGVEGAALWEISTSDVVKAAASAVQIARVPLTQHVSRPIDFVNAKGLVSLTFDDGPDPAWTPAILRILHHYHVPGTFFVVGSMAQRYPSLLQKMIQDGDLIGNHTYTHLDLNTVPRWRALTEINLDSWIIHGITGRTPQLFRSPYGSQELADSNSNAHRNLAKSLGLQPVGWNVETSDWSKPGVAKIIERATENLPHEATILMHDGGGNRAETVAALGPVIVKLKAEGYLFTTVDHLDATLTQPYLPTPKTFWGAAGSIISIASYRLWIAIQDVFTWILSALAVLSILRLAITWIFAVRYSRRKKRNRGEFKNSRTVAVLIPAHNEAMTIEKTLNSLLALNPLPNQIVVAENGSTDDTYQRALAFASDQPSLRISVGQYGPVGKANALNLALQEVDCELVIVLDADTVIDSDFTRVIQSHFENERVGAVAGNVKVGNTKRVLAKLQALEYGVSLALDRSAQAELGVVSVVPGAAGAFRVSALREVGGWPGRTLVEDTDLTVMLHQANWLIPYESGAISYTEAPETSREVIKQRKRWAFGSIEVVALNSQLMFSRKSGRLGLLGLPWLLLSQVLLPAVAPIVDIFLIWTILQGFWVAALSMLLLGIAGEAFTSLWALRQANLPARWVLLLPLARVWWRSLLLVSAAAAVSRWLAGRNLLWAKIARKNSVQV